jgi:DNA uptake protein ComE-like DNA-binding protein
MWKDFFYFTKGQRIGILILLSLIVLVLVANYLLPLYFPETPENGKAFLTEVENFRKSLKSRDSLRQAEWQKQSETRQREFAEKYARYDTKKMPPKVVYSLSVFDPNTIDSVGFVKLGLKPFIASNILKYRSKGGHFKTKEDFSKVYGIQPEKFKELEPYIAIAEVKTIKTETNSTKRTDLIVDLNSADTTLLMQVKGIGRGYAKGIVRFRNSTGGFVSVDQLSEIYGMRPENFEKIKPFCKVDLSLVRKIDINRATVEKLNAHPYISFYQAKAIYELRRKKGKLNSISDLKILTEFTSAEVEKIKPYLIFE